MNGSLPYFFMALGTRFPKLVSEMELGAKPGCAGPWCWPAAMAHAADDPWAGSSSMPRLTLASTSLAAMTKRNALAVEVAVLVVATVLVRVALVRVVLVSVVLVRVVVVDVDA